MKAEHRKELQTNVLADRVGRLVQGFKNPPSTSSIVTWVLVGLAVVTVIAWVWFSQQASTTNAEMWVQLDDVTFDKPEEYFNEFRQGEILSDLGKISKENRRSMPGRTARFQEARFLLLVGLKNITIAGLREDAAGSLQRAKALFEALGKECNDSPVLAQEAWLGAAKSEEALIGSTAFSESEKKLGSVAAARELYAKARDIDPKSFQGRDAARHFEQLDKNAAEVEKFYSELAKRAAAPPPKAHR